jgi:hypothetical protein
MEKFTLAGNAAQKEKYEAELKKTIKKLQRERDQIKAWLTQNEIKDKTALTDTRKLIEQKMEAFKMVERELKTKAYSREGLSAATKMDPQEKEKADLGAWITESVDRLSAQVDKYEAEAEQLQASAKKSKKSDAGKLEKLTQLEKQVERHKGHMSNLEIILRMLENGNLSVEEVGHSLEEFLRDFGEPTGPLALLRFNRSKKTWTTTSNRRKAAISPRTTLSTRISIWTKPNLPMPATRGATRKRTKAHRVRKRRKSRVVGRQVLLEAHSGKRKRNLCRLVSFWQPKMGSTM